METSFSQLNAFCQNPRPLVVSRNAGDQAVVVDGEDLLAEVVVGLRQEEEAPQEGLVDGAAVDEAVDSVDVEEAVVEEGAEEEALVVVEEEAIEVHKSWSQCLDLCGYHFHPLASVLLHRYRLCKLLRKSGILSH